MTLQRKGKHHYILLVVAKSLCSAVKIKLLDTEDKEMGQDFLNTAGDDIGIYSEHCAIR